MRAVPERSSDAGPSNRAADMRCRACGGMGRDLRSIPDHEYACGVVATYACCDSCKTVYQIPMPCETDLSAYYPPRYHSMLDGGFLLRARHWMRARRLQKLLPAGPGAVLDYGCGNGSFLRRAASVLRETELIGFEYADERSVETAESGRLTILRGSLDDLLPMLGPCKALIMNHVIEHLPDPGGVLAALRPKLLPGALFDGQTPNADSFEHRLFGRVWSGYHAPRHTVVFSIEGLRSLLVDSGFESVDIRTALNPAGYAISLASLPHGPTSPGMIVREGPRWFLWVAAGTVLLPIDLLTGSPGMIDFRASVAA